MNVQYFHFRNYELNKNNVFTYKACGGNTYYVTVPTKQIILDLIHSEERKIELRVGKATCHPKENFNKKIGRLISYTKSEISTFSLCNMYFGEKGQIQYGFSGINGGRIILETSPKSERVYLRSVLV